MPPDATDRLGSSPLARALRLLELVVASDSPATIAELAAISGIPKPTVHRLVNHLAIEGMLRTDPVCRGLVPGARLTALFCATRAGSWAAGPVRALIKALVDDIRETCNLGVLDRDAVLYVERIECDWPLRVQLSAGRRVPLHATAIGKLLLAHLPAAARRRMLTRIPRPALTSSTLTDRDALERACTDVRRLGYALNDGENTEGVIGLAVPVRAPDGRVVAGLSVHAPCSRLDLDGARALLPRFQHASEAIAAELAADTPL